MQVSLEATGPSVLSRLWISTRRCGVAVLLGLAFLAAPTGNHAMAAPSDAPYQQGAGSNGLVSIEIEHAHRNVAAGDHRWALVSQSGGSGSGAMKASPNTGVNTNTGYADASPRMDFAVNFVKTGVHYVWIRGLGAARTDDSLHVGLDGVAVSTADRIAYFENSWTWSRDTMDGVVAQIRVASPGVHSINVWMREDGMVADKLLLTTNINYVPQGSGPAENGRQVEAPTVNPKGGEYEDSVTVNLSTGTEGANIHYTLDGSTPTTASPRYQGPLTLRETATVKAIATLTGSSASPVSTATYSVTRRAATGAGAGEYQQASGTDGLVSIELENAHGNTPANGHRWSTVSLSGGSGTGGMQASPNTGVNVNSGYVGSSPRLDLKVNFVKSGVHYVWIRGLGAARTDDSLHVGLNGAAVATADRIAYFENSWTWSRDTMDGAVARIRVPSAGVHTVNVWMREDGMVADKLVLTTNTNYTPKNTGPVESPTGAPTFQQASGGNGLVSIELENAHENVPAGGHSWKPVSPSGASEASAMEAISNTGATINTGYVDTSPRLDFAVSFVKTGVHYVWIRGLGPTTSDDSLHVGLNGAAVSTADRIAYFEKSWTWSRETMDGVVARIRVPSAGVHTVNVWMREDGMVADKLVLTTDANYVPTRSGPAESAGGTTSTAGSPGSSGTNDTSPAPAPDSFPVARPDAISVESGNRITINVMGNDNGLSDGPIKVAIQQGPSSGTASTTSSGGIRYQAEAGFSGKTSLTYRLTDADGDTAVGSVAIEVQCTPCSNPTVMRLSWLSNPEVVDGYRVYYGPTAATTVLELSDLNIVRGDIDASKPVVDYDAEKDLGLSNGQQACFRIRAYRASAISGYSNEACATM